MDARGDRSRDDASEASGSGSLRSRFNKPSKDSLPVAAARKVEKTVSKLRPKVPIIAGDDSTVAEVAKLMASKRADAALLVNEDGALSGIITDNDITRRVVSQFVDPTGKCVKDVMTAKPKCVATSDPALDALEMMVDNKFRHLPVLDENGKIVGLLDIAKCLYEAINILEKIQDNGKSDEDAENKLSMMHTAVQAVTATGGVANQAQLKLMQELMKHMFGESVPTLRKIIGSNEFPSIMQTKNVRDAAILMTKHRKGLLVLDEDEELVGILTPKDILLRVLVANKSPDLTAVASVMTPNPDFVSPELTLLDALREMHDHKYLHLPVCENDGRVVGLVDVMELMGHTAGGEGGGKGWRDFFSGAFDAKADDDNSDKASSRSASSHPGSLPVVTKKPITTKYSKIASYETSSDFFPIDPKQMESKPSYDMHSNFDSDMFPVNFDFKVTDQEGHIHKFKSSSESFDALKSAVALKLKIASGDSLLLKFIDEENDEILMDSDSSLRHAVDNCRSHGGSALKVVVTKVPPAKVATDPAHPSPSIAASPSAISTITQNKVVLAGVGAFVVAAVATVAFILVRRKN